MKRGFTLIELLVVVLIIGILSAVALPQYQKTVLKSRTAEAWTNVSALNTAIKAYCLENPDTTAYYSQFKDALPITIENSNNFTYNAYINCTRNDVMQSYARYEKGGKSLELAINKHGKRVCRGNACSDLGFINTMGEADCVCGSGGSCYYID